MENERKATYKYLSISVSEFSYDHCPEDIKKSMLGKMASNDLAESSFAGVTAQVQCYVRIGMSAEASVSDVGRNGFQSRGGIKRPIDRETASKKKKAKEKERELYFGMVKELQIKLLITCMEESLSISGSKFSYEHCTEYVNNSILGKMASNDLAESSFAGVTAQVQCYGRIGMSAAASVSDVGRNGFLSRGGIKRKIYRATASKNTKAKEKER